jgi:hypothetical protein
VTLLLAALLLGVLAATFVVAPLVARRSAAPGDAAPGALLDVRARRRAALASLKELEYDFVGGKLDDADYRAQRERLSVEALAAIRAAEAAEAAGEAGEGGEAGPAAGAAGAADAGTAGRHGCGFLNAPGSRYCGGCGAGLD